VKVTIRIVGLFAICSSFFAGCSTPVVEKIIPNQNISDTGPKNYKLAPNDVVSITVFQEPDMATQTQISRDGSVSFPLIGQATIGGLSKGEAEALIAKRLSEKYLVDPQVTVNVTEYAPQNYTILGQVVQPGSFPVPSGEDVFTLPMAVARAQGNTRIGNLRNIKIIRYHDKKISQFTVNMLSAEGQQFPIYRGDLITVQETLF
jgi:polysaccharide export outer membrane protein